MLNKNIIEVIERFYICTNLPIIAFDIDGNAIGSSGYNHMFNDLFEDNNIIGKVMHGLVDFKDHVLTVNCSKSTCYTACFIDPKDLQRGLFILGPHSCSKNNSFNIPYKPKCLMSNLVSLLYIIERDINKGRQFKNSYSFHVKKALDYIDSRYNREITLIDIANYLNIHKSYFCSLLRKETGKTFTQILNEVRIEKSKGLLAEGDYSMLDIALAVGFNNQNYYNITFKKITGITPLEFRKNGYNIKTPIL